MLHVMKRALLVVRANLSLIERHFWDMEAEVAFALLVFLRRADFALDLRGRLFGPPTAPEAPIAL
jgi:hypothetical protein